MKDDVFSLNNLRQTVNEEFDTRYNCFLKHNKSEQKQKSIHSSLCFIQDSSSKAKEALRRAFISKQTCISEKESERMIDVVNNLTFQENGRCYGTTLFTIDNIIPLKKYPCITGGGWNPWPAKTDIYCYHCCHPFDTIPIPLPRNYDSYRNLYCMYGNFCSFECAKRYARDERDNGQCLMLLNQFTRDCGIKATIPMAPPRHILKCFGGSLSIDEFRNKFKKKREYRTSNIPFSMELFQLCVNEQIPEKTIRRIQHKQLKKHLVDKGLLKINDKQKKTSNKNTPPQLKEGSIRYIREAEKKQYRSRAYNLKRPYPKVYGKNVPLDLFFGHSSKKQ